MLDSQLILAVVYISFSVAGFVCAVLATYRYVRFERGTNEERVPFAIGAFALQYGLVFGLSYIRDYLLVPVLVMFLVAAALVVAIWVGFHAHSKAGARIASAGVLTLIAYVCLYASPHFW